ncbi:MAG: stage 0 sporulation family protein [Oscillospiraceae bacterium]|nr:stage 0 sporulation family protein [Oscillospiraceae bacterium]
MTEIIGVRFKNTGKTYYFYPNGNRLDKGDMVVVETARGLECGEVVIPNRQVGKDVVNKPLKSVVRMVTPEDLLRVEENDSKREKALKLCQERIEAHGLDMKLVDAEYTFDGNKLLFYFTSDGRVDFRELVKDLAGLFRTRIELRQIGVRDEAKMLGGHGICGQPFCCSRFLNEFQPVSIKMAKEQGLSLNPSKISGSCGRLMCCLKYEQDTYEDLMRQTPRPGALVNTPEGRGMVTEANVLTGKLKVRLDQFPDSPPVTVHMRDIKVIRSAVAAEMPPSGKMPDPEERLAELE